MFRMVPGVDVGSSGGGRLGTPIAAIAGFCAVLAVSFVGLLATQPSPREVRPGETEMAQRSAAVVAGTYGAEVDIDRRDRMLLVSYAGAGAMNADRFAWAVCDTIRTVPELGGVGQGPARLAGRRHAGVRHARLLPHRRVGPPAQRLANSRRGPAAGGRGVGALRV